MYIALPYNEARPRAAGRTYRDRAQIYTAAAADWRCCTKMSVITPYRRLQTLAAHVSPPAAAATVKAAPAAGVSIDLSGKIAVVTGATGQLGRVMVRTLGTAGADVAVHYRSDKDGAESLVAELEAMGVRGCAVFADISDSASIGEMKAVIAAELGAPDIVVTNAVQQVVGGWKSVLEQDEEAYKGQFETCVMQNVLMAKAFIPAMQDKQWGREAHESVSPSAHGS